METIYTTELGQMRAEEMRSRAAQYRLGRMAKRTAAQRSGLSPVQTFVYRRALRAATLTLLVIAIFGGGFASPLI